MSTIVTRAGKGSALTHNEVDANFVNLNTDKAEKTVTNTFTANQIVSVTDNTNAALRITQLGTGNALLVEDSTNPDATPFVIDASGNVIVGGTLTYTTSGISSPRLMQSGFSAGSGQALAVWANAVGGGGFQFLKSRGTTEGSYTIVSDGDTLGQIRFSGSDGTAFTTGALIQASVDGTPGTNDMPGRLVFSTTADGASTPTERMRIDSAGNVGIGGTASAGQTLLISKNITGSVTSQGVRSTGQVQSDVTAEARSFISLSNTQATSFTLGTFNHYFAGQGTIGAGSSVTNQSAFYVASSLTSATNNYGFYGDIAEGTGRWNLYMNGTAANYFGGKTYLAANKELFIGGTTDATTPSLLSDGTYLQLNAPAGSADMRFRVAGVERMRITSAGNVGIGGTPTVGQTLVVSKNITGATTSFAVNAAATVQSDVTTAVVSIRSSASTAASAFTLPSLIQFQANQGTIGATSAVTSQFGFVAESSLIGATNNYGFYGAIASGAGRWNIYMAGTAANYFAGDLTVYGGTAIPAGGTAGSGYKFSSTANFGVFFGSGAPTLSAAKGSLYLRSDGTTTNNRMYVNTDGSTTWTAVTTAA